MADFDYGNARLHAMKARLLNRRQLEELVGVGSVPGVISALMKTAYQPAIEFSIARTSGIETILQALRQDMLQTVRKVRSFYRHEAGEMVVWILRSYDIHNLKAVLRGLGKHIAPAEILSTLMPVGELEESTLVELSRAASPRVAVDMFASMNHPLAKPLLKVRVERPGVYTVEMEIALDRWYHQEFSQFLEDNAQDSEVIVEAFALDTDIINLLTALRFVHTPAERKILRDQVQLYTSARQPGRPSGDDPIRYLLVGPGKLPFALLERIANQGDMVNAVRLLSGSAYEHPLEAGLQAYRQSGRLSDLEKQLNRYRLHWMAHLIPSDPLGIGVFLGFMALKNNEISNLRWIAQGIQSGLKPDAIRKEMEFI